MTNETILQKAIEKAVRNGFPEGIEFDDSFNKEFKYLQEFAKAFWGEDEWRELTPKEKRKFEKMMNEAKMSPAAREKLHMINEIIGQTMHVSRGWKFHLQQMVISDDPIRYLEQFLNS